MPHGNYDRHRTGAKTPIEQPDPQERTKEGTGEWGSMDKPPKQYSTTSADFPGNKCRDTPNDYGFDNPGDLSKKFSRRS